MNYLDTKEVFAGQKFEIKISKVEEMSYTDGNSGTTLFYKVINQTNKTINLSINEMFLVTQKNEQREPDSHLTGYIFNGGKIVRDSFKVGSCIFYKGTCGKIGIGCRFGMIVEDEQNDDIFTLVYELSAEGKWELVDFNLENENDDEEIDDKKAKKYIDTKQLIKNTEILESTFANCNLQVISLGYKIDNCSFDTNIEIAIKEGKLKNDVIIKVNFYDDDNELVCTSEETLYSDEFGGYDTITISSSDDDYYENKSILLKFKKARIFAKLDN